jgi:DNA-binding SARP family transcriptional activator
MEIKLLGAVEACTDGIALPLGGPRQRAVLADLARPPASAKHTL